MGSKTSMQRFLPATRPLAIFFTAFIAFLLWTSRGNSPDAQIEVNRIGINDHRRVSHSALQRRDDSTNGTISQIVSQDDVNVAFSSTNGNVYLEPISSDNDSSGLDTTTYFYGDGAGIIYSDYTSRLLHIYSDEVKAYGVSRVRLHTIDNLPSTSLLVDLVPQSKSSGAKTLVAQTTDGQFLFLAACNIQGQATKIFAISSYPAGLATLKDSSMRSVLVGGVVDDCVLIDLKSVY